VGALLTRSKTEMPLSLSIPGTSQQEHVLSSGSELGKLVEGVGLTASGNNALASSSGEPKSSDSQSLGDVEEPDIIGDGANNGDNAGVVFSLSLRNSSAVLSEVLGDSGDGDGVSVESRLVEALVDHLVELGVGPAGEEGVELRAM